MLSHLVLLALLATPPAAVQAGCDAAPRTRKVLDALQAPGDARLSSAAQKELQLAATGRRRNQACRPGCGI